MTKRFVMAGLALGLCLSAASAAEISAIGTVLSVAKQKVRLVTAGEPDAWIRKGAAVSLRGGRGVIVEVHADTVTITSSKARGLSVGDEVKFEKARRTATGC